MFNLILVQNFFFKKIVFVLVPIFVYGNVHLRY